MILKSFLCSFTVFFLQETKTKEICESMSKGLKMDVYSEARLKVFAAVSVQLVAAKHDLAATNTKFAAVKVSKSKGPGVQPENDRCNENESRCSGNSAS